jgi:hypothetical protein
MPAILRQPKQRVTGYSLPNLKETATYGTVGAYGAAVTNGKLLVTSGSKNGLLFWDCASGECVDKADSNLYKLRADWKHDRLYCSSLAGGKDLEVWQISTRTLIQRTRTNNSFNTLYVDPYQPRVFMLHAMQEAPDDRFYPHKVDGQGCVLEAEQDGFSWTCSRGFDIGKQKIVSKWDGPGWPVIRVYSATTLKPARVFHMVLPLPTIRSTQTRVKTNALRALAFYVGDTGLHVMDFTQP